MTETANCSDSSSSLSSMLPRRIALLPTTSCLFVVCWCLPTFHFLRLLTRLFRAVHRSVPQGQLDLLNQCNPGRTFGGRAPEGDQLAEVVPLRPRSWRGAPKASTHCQTAAVYTWQIPVRSFAGHHPSRYITRQRFGSAASGTSSRLAFPTFAYADSAAW
jgi:hypothetical protein